MLTGNDSLMRNSQSYFCLFWS